MSFSIKAFFGGDTTALRSELGSLEGTVKDSFGKMDQHSKGGLATNVQGIHHAVRQLHQFLVAGGLVEVVKRFFESTIEAANKSKDATDENTQAVKRFGHAWEGIGEATNTAKVAVLGFFNRAGEAWGFIINQLRGYSAEQQALMEKTGSDLEEQTKEFAKRNEIAKIHRDTLFQEADLLGKAKILLGDNHALELQLTKLKVDSVEYAKVEAQIKKNFFEAGKLIADQEEKTAAIRKNTAEERKKDQAELKKIFDENIKYLNESVDLDQQLAKIAFDKLTPEKQLTALLKERKGLLAEINNSDTDENQVKRDKIKLNELDNQLEETKAKIISAEVLEAEKRVTEEKKKQLDLEHQQQAAKMGELASNSIGLQMTDPDRLRSASDASLKELIRRDTDAAFKITTDLRGGEGVSGSVSAKIDRANFQLEADAAQKELDARKAVKGVDYATALRNFQGNPLNFDQFYQSVNSTNQIATQTNSTLSQINSRLKNLLGQ